LNAQPIIKEPIMEILPGVHQIPLVYHGRPLKLYLLVSGQESLLMDTGDAGTPASDILPYFQKIGWDPRKLTYVLLTHPDIDHVGGAYAIREAAPQAHFLCGTLDREQIETPEAMGRLRARAHYYWHDLGPDDAQLTEFVRRAGGANRLAAMGERRLTFHTTLDGGEILTLGERELRILHLPGHSLGHLGVYLPGERAALIGDAVHGTANRFTDGRAAFACTYMNVDAYLGTIDQLQALGLERLYSCHWADCTQRAAVDQFLEVSRAYALRAEEAILETLRAAGEAGLTLREVCLRAKGQLGDWPAEKDLETRSMACGHLQRLANRGLIHATPDRPTRYIAEATWLGLR
jgi:glyoxylase-like metal-dependent hydrolase (beta-lactamase superfamily II)